MKSLVTFILFIVILIEEAFWSIFEALSGVFERFKLIRKLENFVAERHPNTCLALFLIPVLLMLPFKFAGVWLMAHGHKLEGLFMFISAKATGTFLAARLFAITKNKLLSIAWFAYCFNKFSDWKLGVKHYIHGTPSYQAYQVLRTRLKAKLAEWLKQNKG